VRHRRRPFDLRHGQALTAGAFLVAAIVLGAAAALADVSAADRARMVSAEVAALVGWLGLATLGHAHEVAPRGDRAARLTLGGAGGGFAAAIAGILVASPATVAVGGVAIAVTGVLATGNLASGRRPAVASRATSGERDATPSLRARSTHR
jgi:hypothetical protein